MADIKQEYMRWCARCIEAQELMEELDQIRDNEAEINDRFYRDLAFGTGGLRGVIGAGINRMNIYTVRKATQGLAAYLRAKEERPSVCIAYDTRQYSDVFARAAAEVLSANGIHVYFYESVRPTPMLSYAVRFKGASAGIVVTASHNPKEYNGYKVYGSDGGQITDEAASKILGEIQRLDIFEDIRYTAFDQGKEDGLIEVMGEEVDASYYGKVKELALRKDLIGECGDQLKILYSPLHGSGNIPVRRVLREIGFPNVEVVPEQELPDGAFPTVPYPNPEEPAVYKLAIAMAKKSNPDLIFTTDPDCDRIGVLVRDNEGQFIVLSGNQMGILLTDYMIKTRREQDRFSDKLTVVKTIVTTNMAEAICAKQGVHVVNVLTGFKYIGEKIGEWEQNGQYEYLFGFEESYGYLAGTFVRDKDAVIAAVLISEMALYYHRQGRTLYEVLQGLYDEYGHYMEKLITVTLPGEDGQKKIARLLGDLRESYPQKLTGWKPVIFEDYETSRRLYCQEGRTEILDLPKSNVLKFIRSSGDWFVLRPSGTEPKIKVYLSASGGTSDKAKVKLRELETLVKQIIE